jgi:hypothetical protein
MTSSEHYRLCIEAFLHELGELEVSPEVQDIINRRLVAGLEIGKEIDLKEKIRFMEVRTHQNDIFKVTLYDYVNDKYSKSYRRSSGGEWEYHLPEDENKYVCFIYSKGNDD